MHSMKQWQKIHKKPLYGAAKNAEINRRLTPPLDKELRECCKTLDRIAKETGLYFTLDCFLDIKREA